jgi:hypothetical protein
MDLFSRDQVLKRVEGFTPLLAQWEKSTHPAQIRLENYINWLIHELTPLPNNTNNLYLHLEVDVKNPERLLHHYDLENYLTPLFGMKRLNPRDFDLVSAAKRVGGGSYVEVGNTKLIPSEAIGSDWNFFSCNPLGSSSRNEWKESLRTSLEQAAHSPLSPGPVEVHLAWRCSSLRNWVNLWKPTGDALGPVLGYTYSTNIYHPLDDRINRIWMHKILDDSLLYEVEVYMWWRHC